MIRLLTLALCLAVLVVGGRSAPPALAADEPQPMRTEGAPQDLLIEAENPIHVAEGGTAVFAYRFHAEPWLGPFPASVVITKFNGVNDATVREIPLGWVPADVVATTSWTCDIQPGTYEWWIKLVGYVSPKPDFCNGYTVTSFVVARNDRVAPTTVAYVPDGWTNQPVFVHAFAIDCFSGVSKTEVSFDDGATWAPWADFTVPAPVDGSNDGEHWFICRSTDNERHTEIPCGYAVLVDTQPPTVGDNADGATHWSYELVFTANDPTSYVKAVEYRIDGGAWRTGTSVTLRIARRHKVGGVSRGTHLIEYAAIDAAGNRSATQSCSVTLGL